MKMGMQFNVMPRTRMEWGGESAGRWSEQNRQVDDNG